MLIAESCGKPQLARRHKERGCHELEGLKATAKCDVVYLRAVSASQRQTPIMMTSRIPSLICMRIENWQNGLL